MSEGTEFHNLTVDIKYEQEKETVLAYILTLLPMVKQYLQLELCMVKLDAGCYNTAF